MFAWTDGCSDGCSGVSWPSDGTVRAYSDGMHATVHGDGVVMVCADIVSSLMSSSPLAARGTRSR